MALPRAGAEVVADVSNWRKNMAKAINEAKSFDMAVGDVVDSANRLGKEIKGLDGKNINVDVKIGNETALLAFDELPTSQTVTIDAPLGNDAGIKAVDDIPPSQTTEVDTKKGDQSGIEDTREALREISNLAKIQIGLELLPGAMEALKNTPAIAALLEGQDAAALLDVTGNTEALAAAQELYAQNMVTSVSEGAVLINQLATMGVAKEDLLETANAALNTQLAFRAMGQDADIAQIAVAQTSLVTNGLVENATEASDLIASGVLGGLNRRDDLLDTIVEYSSSFRDMGLTGAEAFSAIDTAIQSGFDNTDRPADLLREFNLRVRNPDETAAQDSLKALGLGDETAAFNAGEISGAEFFRGVISAIQKESDPGKQQAFMTNIFGTQAEDFGMGAAFGIDPTEQTFLEIEGRAQVAADKINSTLSNAFTETFNTINVAAANILSDEEIDLDGKLQVFRQQLQTFADEVQSGKTIPESIEIAFGVEGIAEQISRFEAIVGNLALEIAGLIAQILDATGQSGAAADVRAGIADAAVGQLGFDLKLAETEDDVRAAIQRGINRGVETADIQAAASTAIDEMLAGGDTANAQAVVDAVVGSREGLEGELRARMQAVADATEFEDLTLGHFLDPQGDVDQFITDLRALGAQSNIDYLNEVYAGLALDPNALQTQIDNVKLIQEAWQGVTDTAGGFFDRAQSALGGGIGGVLDNLIPKDTIDMGEAKAITEGGGAPAFQPFIDQFTETPPEETIQPYTTAVSDLTSEVSGLSTTSTEQVPIISENFNLLQIAGETVGAALGTALTTLGDTAETEFEAVSVNAAKAKGALLALGGVIGTLNAVSSAISNMNSNAVSSNVTNAGQISIPAAAEGGFFPRGMAQQPVLVGERGPELIAPGRAFSVLNAANTTSLFNAVSGALRGGGGNVTNNNQRSTSNNIVVNNYGMQADPNNLLATALRGF